MTETPYGMCWTCGRVFVSEQESAEHLEYCPAAWDAAEKPPKPPHDGGDCWDLENPDFEDLDGDRPLPWIL